ncbi:hypothetical protein [Novosphingobium sp. JCM 18896]|uniref:hypothetical protein n=1 Tax=Novosphingobium sp. JCM 18896 TaxID=2989731 RepID=UPI00222356AE|nr:hypothetical protein [Novosphingobium sp. JCM 18896]MCW1432224.1 hypothetical protein [Novosphingobium sp. JCM 18896]
MHFDPRRKWVIFRESQLAWADDIIVGFQVIVGQGYELNFIDGNELTSEDQLEIAAEVVQAIKLGSLH